MPQKRFIKEPARFREVMSILKSQIANKILFLLEEKGEMTVSEIVDGIDRTKYTISPYLKKMRKAGLIKTRRDSTRIYCYIDYDLKDQIVTWLNKFPCKKNNHCENQYQE